MTINTWSTFLCGKKLESRRSCTLFWKSGALHYIVGLAQLASLFPFQLSLSGHLKLSPRLWTFVQGIHYFACNKCLEKCKDFPPGELFLSLCLRILCPWSLTTVFLPRFSLLLGKLMELVSFTWQMDQMDQDSVCLSPGTLLWLSMFSVG